MLAKGFKIVDPRTFEIYIENIECTNQEALVKIEKAAICKADIRYYLGKRDKRVLGLKYPMNLLHEAVGTILKDPTGTFKVGEKVALVPNVVSDANCDNCTNKVCLLEELGENYCPNAKFVSSNYNGFSTQFVNYNVKNLVKIPEEISNATGVYTELISVANAAIRRSDLSYVKTIAIWGDGILGYILSCTLRMICDCKIIAIGKHIEKLKMFSADEFLLYDSNELSNIKFDLAYECVGGNGSQGAINSIINHITCGGKVILTGVSENDICINTRKILEKGLSFYGVTRSEVNDFKKAMMFFRNEKFKKNIEKLILDEIKVRNISEFYNIFEMELNNRQLGKYIMDFQF